MIKMHKILLTVLFLIFYSNANGQVGVSESLPQTSKNTSNNIEASKNCSLDYNQIPLLKGLKIGMTYAEVEEVYPEIKSNEWFQKSYRENKSGSLMISSKEVLNDEFKLDLKQLSINIQNGQIQIFGFIYKSNKWHSAIEMRDDLSSVFDVEKDFWSMYNQQSVVMKCKNFTVSASHLETGNRTINQMYIHENQ